MREHCGVFWCGTLLCGGGSGWNECREVMCRDFNVLEFGVKEVASPLNSFVNVYRFAAGIDSRGGICCRVGGKALGAEFFV
jgi:hypothetical protein